MGMAPVSREAHGKMRLRPPGNAAFARALAAAPIVAAELPQVCANFPVFFMEENKQLAPFAMFGLTAGENLMVSPEGQWLGLYLPSVLRLYPFMPQRTVNGGQVSATLLVDESCLSETEGEPLFGPEAEEPRGPVARALQAIAQFEMQTMQTATLTAALAKHELLDPFPLQATRGADKPVAIGGLFSVNEAKLNALADEAYLELRRSGALTLAMTQLLSLVQLARLQALAKFRLNAKP